jgi:hypothetical protein
MQNLKFISLILIAVFLISLGVNFVLLAEKTETEDQEKIKVSEERENKAIKQASAQEIYPLFECPCCGKAINECSCPMAKERMAFIDGLTAREISEQEAVLTYVKKYGLTSFIEEEKEKEFRNELAALAPAERPIISLNSDTYDFGEVSQKKGTVTTFFEVRNNGQSDLIIERLETSCGCTSASIIYQDQEGPKFNMPGHGINEEIEVYIYSNDPIDFQKKVTIELNQVD